MTNLFLKRAKKDNGEHWLTISDLMSGLMIIFLFIAVAFMRHMTIQKDKITDIAVAYKKQNDKITNIAIAYQENQTAIYHALNVEFEKDLPIWNASIDKETLSFQFKSPEILFDTGSSDVNEKFKSILSNFIPRYLSVLEKYRPSIDEIRIEGHTSTEWGQETKKDDAYFLNMELSQGRTRSVLHYAYSLPQLSTEQKGWIRANFAAVGFSSSKAIFDEDGGENMALSRRVTFRVLTNADIQIRKILMER